MASLRVAVIGVGIGAQHLEGYRALPDQFRVIAVCDIDRKRAKKVASKYQVPEIVEQFEPLCERADIDIIDICTPPNLHFQQIQAALDAGKHVFSEKPVVGSLNEIDRLQQSAQAARGRLMPIFQYRFGHGLQRLKRLIDQRLTGEAFVFNVDVAWKRSAQYYANPWRGRKKTELGGALLSQAIHALDMILYIVGPARRVFAFSKTRVNAIEVEDCVAMSLEMADGSMGTMAVTLGSSEEISRHRFTFRNVTAESGKQPYANSNDPWKFSYPSDQIAEKLRPIVQANNLEPEGYAGQFSRFFRALEIGGELPVRLEDARAALEIIAAAYDSSENGFAVHLPIGPRHPRYHSLWPEN